MTPNERRPAGAASEAGGPGSILPLPPTDIATIRRAGIVLALGALVAVLVVLAILAARLPTRPAMLLLLGEVLPR